MAQPLLVLLLPQGPQPVLLVLFVPPEQRRCFYL